MKGAWGLHDEEHPWVIPYTLYLSPYLSWVLVRQGAEPGMYFVFVDKKDA